MDSHYHLKDHLKDPSLKYRGTVGFALEVFAGCSSSDNSESLRSDGADEYVPVEGCLQVERRRRKMLKPKRAAMYGSGVWCDNTAGSQCSRPRPVKKYSEVPYRPLHTPRPLPVELKPTPAPAASQQRTPPRSTAVQGHRKSCTAVCGPCGHCGTTASPLWRRGNDKIPVVCNACGLRYNRTGTFAKAMQYDKKRAASGESGAVSEGAPHAKRSKAGSQATSSGDTPRGNNSPETVSCLASPATTDSRSRKSSSPSDRALPTAASASASPCVTPLAADMASPMELDDPCPDNAAGSLRYAVNHCTQAGQQHVPTRRGRRSQSSSRLEPSPLGRVKMSAEPPARGALAQGQLITDPATAALVPNNQMISGTAPLSAATAVPAVPVSSIPLTTVPLGPINNTAAGTAVTQATMQHEVLQVLSILAPRMGSIEAAIAFMMANAGGLAAGGMVPGQVPTHIEW